MKTLSTLSTFLIFILLTAATAQAQTTRSGRVSPKPRAVAAKAEGIKDGLSMQNGRVVLTELGISNPLVTDKKLINGTVITPAGIVTGTDGTTAQIKEGDQVSLSGRITSHSDITAADSIAKIQLFDALYPGKRKKMEAEAEKKAKAKGKVAEAKEKAAEAKAKAKEKAAKRKK